ncbi:glycoside hydrolase 5 family protein [Rugosimonospora africana]|uniref:Mannan endo-1,4-beta-mannosidase n=1 Tax=Rugosimonospora africana TaxID=556532 RepID=A0A8J3QSU6_9ACTN|nr:beta-mannosidase [Rugosimonospora africana]GIH15841.1 mannan endo-1,4-beta-mannosidase [Rugosimonospora africana]
MVSRPTRCLPDTDQPWIGVNFWSAAGGPYMWRRFDEHTVDAELAALAELGLTVTRSFCFWPDFQPEPYRVDETLIGHFRTFLDLHARHGLKTIPTFIIGGMSGRNFDPPWRRGGNLYADGYLLGRQAAYIRTVTAGIADHPAIAGWLISNEMHFYGGSDDPDNIRAWAELMTQAVRAGGGRGPVSLGDGVLGVDLYGEDNGFRLRQLRETVDWIGPHLYGMGDDLIRQHLLIAFKLELANTFGLPVVLEEFGLTSNFASEEHAGDYYRQVLHSALAAGATGFIAWNNTDFDLVGQPPYSHHPFELHFGIMTPDRQPKQAARELAAFARTLREIDLPRCTRADTDTVLVVPEWLDGDTPGVDAGAADVEFEILHQAYVSARLAGLTPLPVREADGIPDAKLVLVPCGKRLNGPTWQRLEQLARDGALVYVSYFSGDTPGQRGPWHPDFDGMFGIRHGLRYGLVDPVETDDVEVRFDRSFGGLNPGDTLRFRAAGSYSGRSRLPFEPAGAVAVATAGGQPALATRATGRGQIVLLGYPVEYFAARTPGVNPDDTVRLYRALAAEAGALPAIDNGGDPRLIVDTLVRDDGARFAIVISEHPGPVTATVGGTPVALPAFGAAVVPVPPAAADR